MHMISFFDGDDMANPADPAGGPAEGEGVAPAPEAPEGDAPAMPGADESTPAA